jgi:hypothetical protein
MGALRAGFRTVLVAFATTRFVDLVDLDVDFNFGVDFRLARGFAEVFLAVRAPERVLAPRDAVRRAGFAAFRAILRAGFRPLERAPVRELFRAAFLVPPAALRLAIACSLFSDPFGRAVRPEISARLP